MQEKSNPIPLKCVLWKLLFDGLISPHSLLSKPVSRSKKYHLQGKTLSNVDCKKSDVFGTGADQVLIVLAR